MQSCSMLFCRLVHLDWPDSGHPDKPAHHQALFSAHLAFE